MDTVGLVVSATGYSDGKQVYGFTGVAAAKVYDGINLDDDVLRIFVGRDDWFLWRVSTLCAYRKSDGKEKWCMKTGLPGIRVLDPNGEIHPWRGGYLISTDLLGLFYVDGDSGKLNRHYRYSNLDAIPGVAEFDDGLLVGPIQRLP